MKPIRTYNEIREEAINIREKSKYGLNEKEKQRIKELKDELMGKDNEIGTLYQERNYFNAKLSKSAAFRISIISIMILFIILQVIRLINN